MTEITRDTLTLVLAGGVGSRLHPLTRDRAKPAVPFGGKYRIIDFTLSNCLESGLRRILVLTQYKSHSLQKHLRDGWSIFSPALGEYITPVPPQMRTGERWYAGTADAVYQNLYLVERSGALYVLVLSGDHVYRMDYAALLEAHRDREADVTVACLKVPREEASAFGIVGIDETGRIVDFVEKPPEPPTMPSDPSQSLASMGVYVFSLDILMRGADQTDLGTLHDFGRDVLPALLGKERVFSYLFGGQAGRVTADHYWRDVGTIDAYFEANMDLVRPVPSMDLYQPNWRIRTHVTPDPPARTTRGATGHEGELTNSMASAGVIVAGGRVVDSILSPNVRVHEGAEVQRSILMEGVEVGEGAGLRRVIVDKHVRVPRGEQIGFDMARDRERFTVSENGVVVVPRLYAF